MGKKMTKAVATVSDHDLVMNAAPKDLTPEQAVGVYVVVTRMMNMFQSRQRAVRKVVDAMVEKLGISQTVEAKVLPAFAERFKVVVVNSSFGEKVPNIERIRALLDRKKIGFDKVLVPPPPPPPPSFSMEKFEALKTLGLISDEEFASVMDDAKVALRVTVEMSDDDEAALKEAVLGTSKRPLLEANDGGAAEAATGS